MMMKYYGCLDYLVLAVACKRHGFETLKETLKLPNVKELLFIVVAFDIFMKVRICPPEYNGWISRHWT
jgi:hypothetical protein